MHPLHYVFYEQWAFPSPHPPVEDVGYPGGGALYKNISGYPGGSMTQKKGYPQQGGTDFFWKSPI